jgi:3-hexulose-6-phosphate synthase/6-phospho-3-hexuloisomerase
MRGETPFDTLRAVAEAVSIPVSVAGGINSETAAAAVEAGAAIVVVGGAIIKAQDATAAAAEIRRAVDEGVCIETTLYKRADATRIREVLEQVSTANISDAWHRQPSLPGIRPLLPGAHMCGPAVTVRTYAGDWAKPVEAIDVCKPGDVLVVDACDATPAMWGELATHSAMVKGLAGLVVWGAIRDTPEIARTGFPAFSSKVCANAGEPKGFGEIDVPIVIAGQTVRPGDWVVGDDDGVMVLPQEQAVELANRAMDVLEKENRLRGEIEAGKTLSEVAYLQKWEKAR